MKQANSISILILLGAFLLITGCNAIPENSVITPENETTAEGADTAEEIPTRYIPAENEPVTNFGEGPTAIMKEQTGADDIYRDVYEYDLNTSKVNNPDLGTGLGAMFGTEQKATPSDYRRLQQKLVGTLAEDIQAQQSPSSPNNQNSNFDPTNSVATPAPSPVQNSWFLFYGKAQQTANPGDLIGNTDIVREQLELERQVRERVNQRTSPSR
ncbi:MAG: hypothetical protein IGQ45_01060 [Cyanobacterium sp. T60_A2020_053]|nr:hypothetical protein [Cyanobacterium sp. T60_A2020_053]